MGIVEVILQRYWYWVELGNLGSCRENLSELEDALKLYLLQGLELIHYGNVRSPHALRVFVIVREAAQAGSAFCQLSSSRPRPLLIVGASSSSRNVEI